MRSALQRARIDSSRAIRVARARTPIAKTGAMLRSSAMRRALALAQQSSTTTTTSWVREGIIGLRHMSANVTHVTGRATPPVQSKRPGKLPSDVAHTAKWLDSHDKPSPMEYSASVEPTAVVGDKVSCDSPGACKDRFGDDAGLGAPNTYYKLGDTTPENPAKCKYCGLRFYAAPH